MMEFLAAAAGIADRVRELQDENDRLKAELEKGEKRYEAVHRLFQVTAKKHLELQSELGKAQQENDRLASELAEAKKEIERIKDELQNHIKCAEISRVGKNKEIEWLRGLVEDSFGEGRSAGLDRLPANISWPVSTTKAALESRRNGEES